MTFKNHLFDSLTTEFDYNLLKSALASYKHPRVKINQLLTRNQITRVKKGIYIKADSSFSAMVLANMIYGPSYVSQDYALALYSLIPERVTVVTSMTTGRSKQFETPCGVFTYEHLETNLYSHGLRRVELDSNRAYIIASPEKALVDRLWKVKGLNTLKKLEDYLEYDMRFDFVTARTQIKISKIKILENACDKLIVTLLREVMQKRKSP